MLCSRFAKNGTPKTAAYLKCFPGLLSFDKEFTVTRMRSHKASDNFDGFASRLSPCIALLLSSLLRAGRLRVWLDGLVMSPVADVLPEASLMKVLGQGKILQNVCCPLFATSNSVS